MDFFIWKFQVGDTNMYRFLDYWELFENVSYLFAYLNQNLILLFFLYETLHFEALDQNELFLDLNCLNREELIIFVLECISPFFMIPFHAIWYKMKVKDHHRTPKQCKHY
jgi:hypothetical protein